MALVPTHFQNSAIFGTTAVDFSVIKTTYCVQTLVNKNQIDVNENQIDLLSNYVELDEPTAEHLEVLSQRFKHNNFKPLQWKIINALLKYRRDVFAIMTTGYGKSLCYQFPAVFSGGISIVISPLISLMQDQIFALNNLNIPACLLGSAQSQPLETVNEILDNKYFLVYLTPEFCSLPHGYQLLKIMQSKLKITLIAVDEVHCVSVWGNDFRFAYKKLGVLRDIFPDVPILALTATATRRISEEIKETLRLKNPQCIFSDIDRPNLYFAVRRKTRSVYDDLKSVMIYKNNKWIFNGTTIIYCIKRVDTIDVSNLLMDHGIKCLPYHAGMPIETRKAVLMMFLNDEVSVVVATIAFGMGIDKPDIRNVIHYGTSRSIEDYYQEVGRAGRDGFPSLCVTFYDKHDFADHLFLAMRSNNLNRRIISLDLMRDYLKTPTCRRNFIITHFIGKNFSLPFRNFCCDNCREFRSNRYNLVMLKQLEYKTVNGFLSLSEVELAAHSPLINSFVTQSRIIIIVRCHDSNTNFLGRRLCLENVVSKQTNKNNELNYVEHSCEIRQRSNSFSDHNTVLCSVLTNNQKMINNEGNLDDDPLNDGKDSLLLMVCEQMEKELTSNIGLLQDLHSNYVSIENFMDQPPNKKLKIEDTGSSKEN